MKYYQESVYRPLKEELIFITLIISFFRLQKSKISVSKSYIRSVNIMVCKINIHLDIRNGTYGPLAFISGVEHKNPSSGCGITAF